MYTKTIPFKDFKGKPHNQEVRFNLELREFVKLMNEFKVVLEWQDSLQGEMRELSTEEVVEFYNAFEAILLASWGELSEDGLHFRKNGRYEFEESALFAACMEEFVTNPAQTSELLEGIMPKNMAELLKKTDNNLEALAAAPGTEAELKARIEELQAQLPKAASEPA